MSQRLRLKIFMRVRISHNKPCHEGENESEVRYSHCHAGEAEAGGNRKFSDVID